MINNAQEARNISDNANELDKEFMKICDNLKQKISDACEKGLYDIRFDMNEIDKYDWRQIEVYFRNLGFNISYHSSDGFGFSW